MPRGGFHEELDRDDETSGPSNRKFGLTIGVVLAIVGGLKAFHSPIWIIYCGIPAALFIVLALVRPVWLSVPNRLWLKLGLLLHRIVSPVIMAILFYGTILPIGLLMRALGKDPLRLRLDKEAKTYWLPRSDDREPNVSMQNQF